jgi:hypothetical protein
MINKQVNKSNSLLFLVKEYKNIGCSMIISYLWLRRRKGKNINDLENTKNISALILLFAYFV